MPSGPHERQRTSEIVHSRNDECLSVATQRLLALIRHHSCGASGRRARDEAAGHARGGHAPTIRAEHTEERDAQQEDY
jgi:hypothetical protein